MNAPWPVGAIDFGVEVDAGKPNPIFQSGGTGWKQTDVREISGVIYDAADADANRRYKLYVSGTDASGNVDIGVSFSPDGETWTEYGSNPVISLAEDPYVVLTKAGDLYRDGGGVMHCFAEQKFASGTPEQNGINHYTSSDGVTWTADAANPVMEPADAGSGAWETADQTSPCVWWDSDASLFYMLYEGRSSGDNGKIGLAWSTDGTTWTRSAANPLIDPASGYGDTSVVPDDIIFEHGRAALITHGKGASYDTGKYTAPNADPQDWTAADWTSGPGTNPFETDTSSLMAFSGASRGRRWVMVSDTATPWTVVQVETATFDPVLNNAAAIYVGTTAVERIYQGVELVWEPPVPTLEEAILALGPVGYWPLDEAAGSTATDQSGNGRNGTYTGTYTLQGQDGLATFNGGYVNIPDNDAFTINTAEGGRTVFALCKPTSLPTGRKFVVTKGAASNYEWELDLYDTQKVSSIIMDPAGAVLMYEEKPGVVTTAWQGIAFASPAVVKNARFSLYRNSGTALASTQVPQTGSPAAYANGTGPVRIAHRGDLAADQNFVGAIGHVAIFPGRLTDSQVGTIMTAAANEGWF